MKVAVIGVGGVGGYFGGRLAHAFGNRSGSSVEVYFVARGSHLEAIKKNGLVLKTSDQGILTCKPAYATDKIEELRDVDLFIIGVKGFDLAETALSLSRNMKETAAILPLLNGVDVRERLRNHIKKGIIFPACVYVSAYIEEPGVVIQTGKPGRIILGPDPENPGSPPRELLQALKEASITYDWEKDAYPAIWEKYVFIASFGLVSSRFDKTLGEIYEDDHLNSLVRKIMEEIYQIASKKGISLPAQIVETSVKKALLFPREAQTSLQRDIKQKKRNELDLFGRTIVDEGMRLDVPVPVTKQIYEELLPLTPALSPKGRGGGSGVGSHF